MKKLSINIKNLDRFITTKLGLFLFPIILAIITVIFIPVAFAPAIILSFTLIFYRTVRIRGNKILIFLASFFIVMISALTIRTYVAEARYIIGDAMIPLISNHTRVIVDKTSYIMMQPKTGDVVVFSTDVIGSDGSKHAAEAEAHRIKISRIIGTPGDRIEIKEGITWVNDKPLPEAYSHNLTGFETDKPLVLENCQVTQNSSNVKPSLCFYLLSDDNYQNREDNYQFRVIPVQNIIGKVKAKFWPLDRLGSI
ncbi:signal peptidase I [Chamaesiphon sp. VAR_48_metabat_135_sub]|uniref:signal peptidase I n=1 Tax=Chamaesiphon sp. VAR_48_metabat_135_sub TaxID=2964699 RepID=UPI00286BA4B0|nr:signal peptidase I [Chamaesiphon sp. VAR_48_metabat_135_sub]